jgi:hypothetical protein
MCRSGNVLRGDPGSFVRRTAGQAGPPFTLPITTSPPLKPHALNAPWQFNPAPIVIRLVRIRHSAKHPRLNAPLLHRPGLVRFSIPEFDRVRLAGPVGGDGAFCAWRSSGGAFSAQTLAGGSWIVSGRACRTGILERRAEGRLDGVSVGGRATQGSKFVRPPNRGTGGTAVYAPNHHIPSAQTPGAKRTVAVQSGGHRSPPGTDTSFRKASPIERASSSSAGHRPIQYSQIRSNANWQAQPRGDGAFGAWGLSGGAFGQRVCWGPRCAGIQVRSSAEIRGTGGTAVYIANRQVPSAQTSRR